MKALGSMQKPFCFAAQSRVSPISGAAQQAETEKKADMDPQPAGVDCEGGPF